jgi:hypothetical protein
VSNRGLDDVVRDADRYYKDLSKKDTNQTRLDVAMVGIVIWFSAFIALGLGSLALAGCLSPSTFSACVSGSGTPSSLLLQYLILSAGVDTAIAVSAAAATYMIRRRRRLKLEELGVMLSKMKQGEVSPEDGLHLMDAVHEAALVVKKRKVDSAFEYGVVGFILVDLFNQNIFAGILVGLFAYLYFRERAQRDFEKEEKRYEDSKKDLLQTL